MAPIQIRVLLMALTAGSVIAQLEPDIKPALQPVASLTNLLRNAQTTTSRQQPQTQPPPMRQNTNPATTTIATTTQQPASSAAPTTTSKLPQPSQQPSQQNTVTTTTPIPPTTLVPNLVASDNGNDNNKFQYVKPLSLRCQHNNLTYSIGQRWNDDCLQVCECVTNGDPLAPMAISACRNRCPTYKDPPGDSCSLQRSKSDECCLDWVCDTEGRLASSSTTVMNTERGQLNVSTTEIKFPASASSPMPTTTVAGSSGWPLAAQSSGSPSPAAITTTASSPIGAQQSHSPPTSQVQITTTTSTQAPPQTTLATVQQTKVINKTTTTRAQVPTTTITPERRNQPTAAAATTTTTQASAPTTTTPTTGNSRSPKAAPGIGRSPDEIVTQTPGGLPAPKSWVTTTTNQPMTRSSILHEEPRAATGSTTTTTTEPPADDEVNPLDLDLCIIRHSDAYRVNQSWLEEPCKQTCRCVFRSEPRDPIVDVRVVQTTNMRENSEQTEIRCGLPAQCFPVAMKLVPSLECPSPKLIIPQSSLDKCACPRVACGVAPKQPPATTTTGATIASASRAPSVPLFTSTTTTSTAPELVSPSASSATSADETPSSAATATGCRAKQGGRQLNFGETFNDECHSTCRCYADSEIRCQQLLCPQEPAADPNCAKWISDPTFRANSTENRCCPQFVCKEPVVRMRSCHMMGKETQHGERLPEEIQPRTPDCEKACHCNDGKIICQPVCPPLGDTPPEDLTGCQPEQAYKTSDECCPKWACPITEEYALQGFDVTPMNATSVEVSFVLPLFAVGRKGRAELNYTGVPASQASGTATTSGNDDESALISSDSAASASDMPPANAHWVRKTNIKTTDGIFVSQSIKYHLNNLKPAHKYWFKLIVYFHNEQTPLDDPLESPLQRVVMPPLSLVGKESTLASGDERVSGPVSTTTPAPSTRLLQPKQHSTNSQHSVSPISNPTTSTTTTTTTTTEQPPPSSEQSTPTDNRFASHTGVEATPNNNIKQNNQDPLKPEVGNYPPCSGSKTYDNNGIDDRISLPWTDHTQMNVPIQKYAWHFLAGFLTMTVLFTIVSFMYLKKSSRVIAPITSQSAYDNPSFTKLKSYNPQTLLIDETSHQNYSNDAILAKQKNLEVDKSSPFHHHQLNDLHHHNGRQHLI